MTTYSIVAFKKLLASGFRKSLTIKYFFQNTGLIVERYWKTGLRQESYKSVPLRRVASALYIIHPDYLVIPKPKRYKTFFVTRDPRDLVVSFYFSTKYSHQLIAYIPTMRTALASLSIGEGLKYAIDALDELGVFEAQRSWLDTEDEQHKIFRYEDLARDNRTFLRQLLNYLKVEISEENFNLLYNRHTYENYSKGRPQGKEDINSHYRKGVSGDWKDYFDEDVMKHFRNVTDDLVEALDYNADESLEKLQPTHGS